MSAATSHLPDRTIFSSGPVARLFAAIGGEGEEIRVAGGAVRNAMLGLPLTDIDCATTAVPDEVTRRAAAAGFRTVPTGVAHGTVTVIVDETPFEVTTLRSDIETDGRRAVVSFGRDFAEDAARRDFTINALYADADGLVTDFVGGLDDLAARRVRFIGDAATRIREDYLRILRFFRFHATYSEGAIDGEGLSACVRERDGFSSLSRERVRAELMKLLTAPKAVETLAVMDETGFLTLIFGGVASRPRFTALREEYPEIGSPALSLAALGVECVEDAARLRERLALSNDETDLLHRAARAFTALRAGGFRPSEKELKALAYRLGIDIAPAMTVCLIAAKAPAPTIADGYIAAEWAPPSPPWRGADAIAAGVAAGPEVGAWLARAEADWIEADFPSEPEILADIWSRARPAAAEEAADAAVPDASE
ncbi:MAG: hypothetical protein BGP06_03250 [Rhizobiales bacterium 65-9]|nr:CCA tRNA nucleotidyltransferase [Hyphomicrobiales bacterium]OJY35871.1 MAG: hypothetical protein BGP06_03250 [Rhizobiales bacterium 65-9]